MSAPSAAEQAPATEAVETNALTSQLEIVSKALVQIDVVSAGIAELRAKYQGVLFDVKTPKGMKEACEARAEVREPRYEVERLRKAAKRPILDLGKKLDTEAERITNELLAIEGPLDLQIKAEEERKAAEKKAKEEAEAQRVALIRGRIEDDIRAVPLACIGRSARDIGIFIKDIESMVVDHTFAEFQKEAEGAKATTLIRLRAALASAQAIEAEQARLAAERAENERIRQENEAAAKIERERVAEAQRLAKEELERDRLRQQAAADVERARIAEEERVAKAARDAEAARQAAENERIRAEQEAAAQAERDRLAAEQAALQARIDAQKAEEARVEAQRQEEANQRAAVEAAQQAEAQRITDAREQLERDQEALRAEREKPAPVYGDVAGTFADTATTFQAVDTSAPESGSVAPATEQPADPLLMTIRLTEWLPMQSVCKAAKEWAVFQHNRPEQKKDRKLAQQAREAEANLLAVVEQLP